MLIKQPTACWTIMKLASWGQKQPAGALQGPQQNQCSPQSYKTVVFGPSRAKETNKKAESKPQAHCAEEGKDQSEDGLFRRAAWLSLQLFAAPG